jgi:class 3 adenylate cyclase
VICRAPRKTIGDAVMAVFETPERSLQAAPGIQRHVGEFNARLAEGQEIVVKIGLHTGRRSPSPPTMCWIISGGR